MNKMARKIALLLAAVLAAGTITACGAGTGSGIAKYGSEEISTQEAEFWLRYQQWMSEAYYWDFYTQFGYENMWEAPISETQTYGEYMQEDVMRQLNQTRVLKDHAAEYGIEGLTEEQQLKVADAVSSITEEFPKFLEKVSCTEEQMNAYITDNAIASLVIKAVKDSTQVEVTDEECAKYSVEYILVTEPEETQETEAAAETEADAEKPEGLALAGEILKAAEAGSAMDDIAQDYELNNAKVSYLVNDETDTAVPCTASREMKAGEIRLVSADNGWYIVKKVDDFNEEATETERQSRIDSKKTEAFNEQYAKWTEAAPRFVVNEKAWANYTVKDKIYEAEEAGEGVTVLETDAAADGETQAAETEAAETEAP